jgi:hypothetical protein
MLKGKQTGEMKLDNGSAAVFLSLGEETVSSLTEKLKVALGENERLKTALRKSEERVETLEQERD